MTDRFTRKQIFICLGLATLAHIVGLAVGLPLTFFLVSLFGG